MSDMDQVRVNQVRVTNNLDFDFTDMFDGVPVKIKPGETRTIPLEYAAHFFGYEVGIERAAMLRHVARRQGWNSPEYVKQDPSTRKTLAEQFFDKLKIEPVIYKLVEVGATDPQTPIPADAGPDTDPPRSRGRPRIQAEAAV